MRPRILNISIASALLLVLSGCASQPGRISDSFNPFCTLAGAVVGGGGAAIVTAAAGPIGAGLAVGAMLGTLACTEGPAPEQPVAAAPAPAVPMPAPDPDRDGDGVSDRLDRCPNTPAGAAVDARGCPDVLLTLTGVNFRFDSANLEPESGRILDQAAHTLKMAGSIEVRVVGHTDNIGSNAYNQHLSERRANTVRDYLAAHGVNNIRMSTEGMGESQPVASNSTEEGRYQNRRVEFHVDGGGARMSTSGPDSSIESWRQMDQTVHYYGQ